MTKKKKDKLGIDECPVRGCGFWVSGTGDGVFHGFDYECEAGHVLLGDVQGKIARLVPARTTGGRLMRAT